MYNLNLFALIYKKLIDIYKYICLIIYNYSIRVIAVLKKIREEQLLSKSELARKAGLSVLTIDRIEKGMDCRISSKRKIMLALGYDFSEKDKVFPSE